MLIVYLINKPGHVQTASPSSLSPFQHDKRQVVEATTYVASKHNLHKKLIKFTMKTYPGMSLGGEVRETEVNIDDDDLSDVEDEVFVRNGTNGYKFSKDFGVKRPLMAPKRRIKDLILEDKNSRTVQTAKRVCWGVAIVLFIFACIFFIYSGIKVFPLLYNDFLLFYRKNYQTQVKLLPCSHLKVSDVWTVTLPHLTSESSIRSIDVDDDGVEDFIFGFGTNDNTALHPDIFCPIFMGVASPCGGGVIALNGKNGAILWRKHMSHTIFTILCSADLNNDTINDCLITGKGGILAAINSRNGSVLWQFDDHLHDNNDGVALNFYSANFIPDQDNDDVMDILAGHMIQKEQGRIGDLLLISGKTGNELQKLLTPRNVETLYMPQVLPRKDGVDMILLGTGSPTSPGNLTVFPIRTLMEGNITYQTIYEDKFKGVMSPCVLVDLTGDGQLDIVSAMFNSTIVAIDGADFTQLWNVTVNNSESLSVPIPGYFNGDDTVDFLVKYQTGTEFPVYYYSQTFIIDGKTGNLIYDKAVVDTVGSQMGGLALNMNGSGLDYFVYWTADCDGYEGRKDSFEFLPNGGGGGGIKAQNNADLCRLRFNSTKTTKLYALNQFNQPPGLKLYSSDERINLEYNKTKTPIDEAYQFIDAHPEFRLTDDNTRENAPDLITTSTRAQDKSSFRHKFDEQGIIKTYNKPSIINRMKVMPPSNQVAAGGGATKFNSLDYEQAGGGDNSWSNYPQNVINNEDDYNGYIDEERQYDPNPLNSGGGAAAPSDDERNRDARGGDDANGDDDDDDKQKTLKKNLSDGVYGYKNVRQSKGRLLQDLESTPTEILQDTYFKNMERQLRKSRLEQRDIESHVDKLKENEEVQSLIDGERKKALNMSESLWDLETEKEKEDRAGYWRGKRDSLIVEKKNVPFGIQHLTNVGTLVKSLDATTNSIDLVFLTYWVPPSTGTKVFLESDVKCVDDKIKDALNAKEKIFDSEDGTLSDLFKKQCVEERLKKAPRRPPTQPTRTKQANIPYYNQIAQLHLGQMTVYRVRIECSCEFIKKSDETCTNFLLPEHRGTWSSYLNEKGDGIFLTKH